MKTFFQSFADSAKEFRNLRSVITAALLVAIHTIMALFLSITVTESLRISVSFIVNVVIGCLYGPIMGLVCGGIGDIVQYLIKPTGPYFFGWTISAALAGLIYGSFFYGKMPRVFQGDINKDYNVNNGYRNSVLTKVLFYILPVCSVILTCVVPFAQVKNSAGEQIVSGTALHVITQAFRGHGSINVAIIAAILGVLSIVLIVLNIWNLHAVPLFLTVFCSFAAILSMYTDKKTTSILWGFWLIIAVLVCDIILQIVVMAEKHKVDLPFMIRCILVLTADTVFINILLGTYWVNFMYGKGFFVYLTTRLIKNLIQLPINIMITYYVLGFLRNIKKHVA